MAPKRNEKKNVKAASENRNNNLKTNIESLTKKSHEVEKNIAAKRSANLREGCWTKFSKFCSDNELENPSIISGKTVNSIKSRLAFKCCAEEHGFKTA